MTPTPHGQVPEALRIADEFKLCNEYDSIPSMNDIAKAEAELRRLHAHIAELEAVGAGGVQALSAAQAIGDELRDTLVAVSAAIADQDDRAAQAMLREILAAPQPSTTPPADSHPAPVLLSDEELCQIEEPYLLNFRIPLGGQYDFARAVEKAVLAKTYGTQAPQPSPTPQADSQPAPVRDRCTKQQMTAEVLRRMQQQEDGHNKNPFRSLLDRLMRDEGGYSTIEIGQLKYALDGFYGAARAPADSGAAPAGERENLDLRRMLCVAHAGAAAYMDDGEAQDSRDLPVIDFLRDTPAEIQDKLHRRALKKLAAPTSATQADGVLEDASRESEYRRGYLHGYEQRDAEVRGALV